MYLFCVNGNLAKGNMGELNLRVYSFYSCMGALGDYASYFLSFSSDLIFFFFLEASSFVVSGFTTFTSDFLGLPFFNGFCYGSLSPFVDPPEGVLSLGSVLLLAVVKKYCYYFTNED
jgi:hypothetical protein